MPHVLGLKQKDVCQRFRLSSWILVGFVAAISCAKNQERDRTTEAASKAQTIAATHALHAFSTPIGKDCEGGNEKGIKMLWEMGVLWSGKTANFLN